MTSDRQPAAKPGDIDSRVIDIAIRLAIVGLLIFWAIKIIGPFVLVVLWGVILAVTLYPVYTWLASKVGSRLSAFLLTLIALAVLIGPVGLLVTIFVDDLREIAQKFVNGEIQVPPPSDGIKSWPLVGDDLYDFWSLASSNLEEALSRVQPQIKTLGGTLLSAVAGVGIGLLQFAASIVIAGFLFRPAQSLTGSMKAFASRITPAHGEEFVGLSVAAIRNVARGVIGVSLLQAILSGIGLMVAGIPGAGLIAFAVLLLGILQIAPGLPVLGAVVWAWMNMETGSALIFTLYMVPVSLSDNFLKPIVMAAGLSTPMLVIFIGAIGGTIAHGLIGLFIGPIVLAVAYEVLTAWVRSKNPAETKT
ncbi:MAG TPA: AI-2E family transporter [Kiloniellaceae bacterium]|nr:AI-2E family transporter [Kiloniellaceae bacterium]